MSSFKMNMNFGNNQQTSQQTSQQTTQQTSQQTLRMGSTTRRVCAALYVQGNKTCNTCGSKRK
tara:strand:+ start:324 stop:512 length:189 start_codon:yes stop_codon:yes gene_type:complete